MNKQELIKHFEELPYVSITQMGKKSFIDLIEQLDESEKVVVPQFVANYIEYAKNTDWDLQDLFKLIDGEDSKELQKWFYHECNQETLAKAWLDGYEVEKKRYLVTIKGIVSNFMVLKHNINEDTWYMSNKINYTDLKAYHTKKELEEAGFGWVFDCPGIEIEEVE